MGYENHNLPQSLGQEKPKLEENLSYKTNGPAAKKHKDGGQNLTKTIMQTHESEEEGKSFNLHEETLRRRGQELSQKWG